MSQYPFQLRMPMIIPYPGYIVVSDTVKEHYIEHFEEARPSGTPFVTGMYAHHTYMPEIGKNVFCVDIARLKKVYEIPGHIPDKQLVMYIEEKLLLVTQPLL